MTLKEIAKGCVGMRLGQERQFGLTEEPTPEKINAMLDDLESLAPNQRFHLVRDADDNVTVTRYQ